MRPSHPLVRILVVSITASLPLSGCSKPAPSSGTSAPAATAAAATNAPAAAVACAACADGYKDPKGRFCIELPPGYVMTEDDPSGAGGTQQSVEFKNPKDAVADPILVWINTDHALAEEVKHDMHPSDYKVDEDKPLPGGGRLVHARRDDDAEHLQIAVPGKGGAYLTVEASKPPAIAAARTLCAPQ